jgi:hypothetical protein
MQNPARAIPDIDFIPGAKSLSFIQRVQIIGAAVKLALQNRASPIDQIEPIISHGETPFTSAGVRVFKGFLLAVSEKQDADTT